MQLSRLGGDEIYGARVTPVRAGNLSVLSISRSPENVVRALFGKTNLAETFMGKREHLLV